MDDLSTHDLHREYSVRIENVCLKLLVDEPASTESTPEYEELFHIMHDHASSELFVCGKGDISIQFQSGILRLASGEAAIIPKGILHTKCPDTRDAEWYAISFLCSRLSSSSELDLYKLLSPIVDCEKVLIFKNASDIFNSAERIIKTADKSGSVLPAMHMTELILSCTEHEFEFFEDGYAKEDPDVSDGDGDLTRIAKLDRMVYNSYTQNLTSDEIAAALFISSRQLDRISRKRYGKPLHRVIVDRRISSAEKMLSESDLTVDKIGSMVGFGSRSGFYREFERKHGMTPAEYRKKNR
jgi:AraC-like DNA-binding protein